VIRGEPYKYRQTSDGGYVLYSVGWNEKDDGGLPGKRLFDDQDGDWVWKRYVDLGLIKFVPSSPFLSTFSH
jgi:hypothetical protein